MQAARELDLSPLLDGLASKVGQQSFGVLGQGGGVNDEPQRRPEFTAAAHGDVCPSHWRIGRYLHQMLGRQHQIEVRSIKSSIDVEEVFGPDEFERQGELAYRVCRRWPFPDTTSHKDRPTRDLAQKLTE